MLLLGRRPRPSGRRRQGLRRSAPIFIGSSATCLTLRFAQGRPLRVCHKGRSKPRRLSQGVCYRRCAIRAPVANGYRRRNNTADLAKASRSHAFDWPSSETRRRREEPPRKLLGLLRDDLAVLPEINWHAVHARDFVRGLCGTAKTAIDSGKPRVCLQHRLVSRCRNGLPSIWVSALGII